MFKYIMLYIFLALFAALGFSVSDICSKYLLNNGVSNLQFLFWAHGIAFVLLTLLFIIIGTQFSLKFLTIYICSFIVKPTKFGKESVF